jgi:hypothetical protein
VQLSPTEPPSLEWRGVSPPLDAWSLYELAPAPGYAAALAVCAGGAQLRCWNWTEAA